MGRPMKSILGLILPLFLCCCGGGGFGDSAPEEEIQLSEIFSDTEQPATVTVSFKAKTRLGDPIADLTINNFEILENNDPISLFEATPSISKDPDTFVYNTLLLMDLSGSVLSNSLESLKEAATTFVNATLAENDDGAFSIKLAFFDGRESIVELTDYIADMTILNQAIDGIDESISVDSSTNLYGAVIQGVDELQTTTSTFNLSGITAGGSLVIFTDGNDQAARESQSDAQRAVNDADENLTIFTIGLEGEIDENILMSFGRDGSSLASNISGLVAAFGEIAERISDEVNSIYVFKYCSPKRSGSDNQLTIRATYEGEQGSLNTEFSAVGFTGGCVIDP